MLRRSLVLALLVLCSFTGYFFLRPHSSDTVSGDAEPRTFKYIPIIDPGHGGFDPGTESAAGTLEKDLNLAIGIKTDLFMRFLGLRTVMTRDTDTSLDDAGSVAIRQRKASDIRRRVQTVNGTENGVLLSIHQNYFEQSRYRGAQVFYHGSDNMEFADTMQGALRLLDTENTRQSKNISSVYLLKHSDKPSVLVECGFLSNAAEDALLQSESYQRKLAVSITKGFLDWSRTNEA
jgi:N-acetylmuramoyl-L-alanine amidase